jgi:hypothetical protein
MNSLDSYFLHIKISNDGFEIWDTDQEGATDKLNLTQTLDKLKEILEAKDGICDFNYIADCTHMCEYCTSHHKRGKEQ